ncbi:hypothetical protein PspLS_10830 [Pyricularia sp. CBS 133598]|nr:hypothetical protein PspLS_10830 [Pyricularia sp. CBS 133598]
MHFHTVIANLVVMTSLGAAYTFSAEQPINQLLSQPQDISNFRGMAKGRKSSNIDCDRHENGGLRRPITACISGEAANRRWYLAGASSTDPEYLRRNDQQKPDQSERRGAAKLSKKHGLPKSAGLRDPAPTPTQ